MPIQALPALAPIALAVAAAFGLLRPGRRPLGVARAAQVAALLAVAAAAVAVGVLAWSGPTTVTGIRLDAVSASLLALVTLVGWVVLRYTASYMDGEAREGAFTGWLCATLSSVMLLVISGHLLLLVAAWIATSVCLHRLLLFYPQRRRARLAARKKFVMARLGDAALCGAAVILAVACGSGDIAAILAAAGTESATTAMRWAALLLALAAALKSAQFPTHGWLTEVMEAPTPVSALLHAGVINAGGFLLIRFADVILQAPLVMAALVALGGFTALFGAMVMLTQPAVKTSLAWSTVGQMGFMVMQCGLGLFPLALLHLIAHSLYKAHAFLASGSGVDQVTAARRPGPVAVPGLTAVGGAFATALATYIGVGLLFGLESKPPQVIALGLILILGVAYLLAQGFADHAPRALTRRTSLYALATTLGYFALHALTTAATGTTLPPPPAPGPLAWALMALALMSFAAVAVAQTLFPLWACHPAATGLRVHLANGLYANALLDRLLGAWRVNDDIHAHRRTTS
ncbi:NADH-quinone oxidoreductase subunit L [Arhodomonas sp. KWT2]